MRPSSVLLSTVLILSIFNFIYIQLTPNKINNMILGAITGMITSVLAIGVISGIQVLGSGLNSESIKILFGVSALLNILFQISIGGFPIGLGLINNLYDAFASTDFLGIGLFLSTTIAIITLVSGIITIVSVGGG